MPKFQNDTPLLTSNPHKFIPTPPSFPTIRSLNSLRNWEPIISSDNPSSTNLSLDRLRKLGFRDWQNKTHHLSLKRKGRWVRFPMQPGVKWHPGSLPKSARCLTDSIQTFHNLIAMDLLRFSGFYGFSQCFLKVSWTGWLWNLEQMSSMAQLKNMGLLKSQGLVGSNWADAQDGRTFPVCLKLMHTFQVKNSATAYVHLRTLPFNFFLETLMWFFWIYDSMYGAYCVFHCCGGL